MGDICSQCGREYKQIASHWRQGQCEYPSFSDRQRQIITGLLMSDGSIDSPTGEGRSPRLECAMITQEYLEYISDIFDSLGGDVSVFKTAEEAAKMNRKSGSNTDADASNYSDVHRWRSMRHPELEEFADWYSTGEKVWPNNIQLTSTVLKHWYCGDGHWDNSGSNNCIQIAMANERERTDKINTMFESVGLPAPSNYSVIKRADGRYDCKAQWTVKQSRELWAYMGDPIPGFERKWPESFK